MIDIDFETVYSLYNEDEDIVWLYDKREWAEKTKARVGQFVPIRGPFEHERVEKQLILAAQRTLEVLGAIQQEHPAIAQNGGFEALMQQIHEALEKFTHLGPDPALEAEAAFLSLETDSQPE